MIRKLDPHAKQALKAQRAFDNVVRLRLVSAVIVAVVIWFSALNIAFILAGSREFSAVPYYAALYASFFLLNAYTLGRTFYIQRMMQRGVTNALEYSRYLERVISGYVYLMLLLGAFISLVDQSHYGHMMVYALTLLLTSAFLLTDAHQLGIPLILSAVVLFVGLLIQWGPGPERMHAIQELFAYVPIAFVVSRIMHSTYLDAWHSNMRLQQQIRQNELLNDQLHQANGRLEAMAVTDEVTGIANRRGLNMHLEGLLAKSGGILRLTAIMIDIDYFKEYNDMYGHEEGDKVLAAVAKVLSNIARATSGFAARWGGEEFVYVTSGLGKGETLEVCKRIQEAIRAAAISHGNSDASKYVTMSQGACSMDVRSGEDIALCLRRADEALYRIKSAGRDGFAYCDGVLA